jgi:hypothetical protein
MRRIVAVIVLLLLFAPEASAQMAAGQPVRMGPTPVELGAQASVDTSYLIALYMTQLAAAGAAPTRADIDEATRQYFTNGAAATGVPASGPGAAYFTNGAAATGVPTSGPGAAYFSNGAAVMAYSPPWVPAAPEATGEARATSVGSESLVEDAGSALPSASTEQAVPTSVAPSQAGASSEVRAASTETGLTCSPQEIEAAMAIARQFATVSASLPLATSWMPPTASTAVAPPAAMAPACAPELAPECPPAMASNAPRGPSFLSRVAVALSGAFLGALAVALWLRPRPIRAVRLR